MMTSIIQRHLKLIAVTGAITGALLSTTAFGATRAAVDQQRSIEQQQRIEQGLKSGSLTTSEAGKLEREQAKVERTTAHAIKDGKVTAAEQNKISKLQNQASSNIQQQKTDAQTGNPNSVSSQRMQKNVKRNVQQQKRIQNGMQTGSLTSHEAASMKRGQAHVDAKEARAAADGRVVAGEQTGIQRAEDKQSKRITAEKND